MAKQAARRIVAEGIEKRYTRGSGESNVFYAVRAASLSLEAGTLTVLTGRSGGGKTTLLNMLAGLLTPSSGRVLSCGEDIYAMAEDARARYRNRHLGYVPQGQSVLQSLNVLENVLLPATLYGATTQEARERAASLLERMGIAELKGCMPSELSGGELRRVAIARALLLRPDVLYADEPTGDLDDENTTAVLCLLREAAREGTAVLLVTHEDAALAYADVRWRMKAGELSVM